jgi:hypothetical protein
MVVGQGPGPRRGAPSFVLAVLVAALAGVTLVALVEPVSSLPDPIARNYNEGWNAFRARAAVEGENLYPPSGSTVFNNYPPLSFHLVGGLAGEHGDPIVVGRALALLSLLVVSGAIGVVAAALTGAASRGWLAALLVLGWFAVRFPHYVAMNDPQMFGHALQYVGLAVLVRHGRARSALIGSMLLLLLGGLVKHVLLPVPLAVAAWLFAERRRDFLVWLVAAIVAVVVALVTMASLYGAPVFEGILLHERAMRLHLFAMALQNWLVPLTPLLAGATALLVLGPLASRERLILIAAGSSALVAIGVSFGEGVSYNAVFDLTFSTVILCTSVFDRLIRLAGTAPGAVWYAPLFLGLIIANLLVSAPLRVLRTWEAVQSGPERVRQAREDIAFVASTAGPVLCEDAALAHWAGKSYEVDFFNYGQRIKTGADGGSLLLVRLREREFGLVQLEQPGGSARLDPVFDAAITEHYELARISPVNGWLYRPRPADE